MGWEMTINQYTLTLHVRHTATHALKRCDWLSRLLQATADALKRQVKEEIHSRTLITSRMVADAEQQNAFESESGAKLKKVRRRHVTSRNVTSRAQ